MKDRDGRVTCGPHLAKGATLQRTDIAIQETTKGPFMDFFARLKRASDSLSDLEEQPL